MLFIGCTKPVRARLVRTATCSGCRCCSHVHSDSGQGVSSDAGSQRGTQHPAISNLHNVIDVTMSTPLISSVQRYKRANSCLVESVYY